MSLETPKIRHSLRLSALALANIASAACRHELYVDKMTDYILYFFIPLVAPCLIVGIWRKHPVLAFMYATVLLYLSYIVGTFIQMYQTIKSFGGGGVPEVFSGGLSHSIVNGLFILVFALPLLAIFQWVIRRVFKKTD